jgi:hypothetical protein
MSPSDLIDWHPSDRDSFIRRIDYELKNSYDRDPFILKRKTLYKRAFVSQTYIIY